MNDSPSPLSLDALGPWLPRLVLDAATGVAPLPDAADARACAGAALFADIVGYTRFARGFARHGRRGAEMTRDLLDTCFAHGVEHITAHGGDVLGFAGDALIGFWHGGSQHAVAAAAAACARAIQSGPLPAPASLAQAPLHMRIGVGVGNTWLMRVGGHRNSWICLAAGEPFTQMGVAMRTAAPGDVALSPQTLMAMAAGTDAGVARPLGNLSSATRHDGRLDREGLHVDALRSYLPNVVMSGLAAGHADWMAELRTVSVIFCTILDLDFADPRHRRDFQAFVEEAQRIELRLGGAIPQVTVDDKGSVLIMAFGLPTLGHEDDAARALQAASELSASLQSQNRRHGVGVATGQAYCGGCGPAARRGYMVIGDAVNQAARLSQRGAAGVLSDEATREAAAQLHRWPASEPASRQQQSTFVGRHAEAERLLQHVHAFRDGRHRHAVVLVGGLAGAGKTTLVSTVMTDAAGPELRVVYGSASAIGMRQAYQVWTGVIGDLLGLAGLTEEGSRQEAVRAGVLAATGADVWAPLLSALLSVDLPENETTRQMSGQVRGRTTVTLLLRLIECAARARRLVIVLDDVQWCDGSSAALLSAIHRARLPVFLALVKRSETDSTTELQPLEDELLADPDTFRITLGGMSMDELRLLLSRGLHVDTVPDALLRMVAERSEGNPFFARELVFALRDAGALIVEQGRCRLAEQAPGDIAQLVPHTVKSVVTQRLDLLNPGPLITLKVGSVLGQSFSEDDVQAVFPLAGERAHIREHLDRLSALQLTQRSGQDTWTFAHAIIRDATYDLIPQAQRERLHRAAAMHLEGAGNFALLAHHWGVAGHRVRALACLEHAGDESIARGSHHEAVTFFTRAIGMEDLAASDAPRRAHWHAQLAEALYGLGHLGQSRDHVETGLRLLGRPLPRSNVGWAVRGARETATQVLALAMGRRPLPRSAESRQRYREASRLMNIVSEQFYFSVEIQKMVVSLLATINLAEVGEARANAARAYGTLGYVVGLGRLHALSRVYFQRGVSGQDAGAHVNTSVGRALYHLAFGRWHAGLDSLEDGQARATAVGDVFGLGLCLNVIGDIRHLMGMLPEATDSYDALVANARARSNSQHEVWGLSGGAETLVSRGAIDAAHRRLQECAEVLPLLAEQDRLSAFRHSGVKALVLLRLGDTDGAAAALDEACRLHAEDPTPMYATYWAVGAIYETALSLWSRDGRSRHLPPAVRDARRMMRQFSLLFPIARGRRAWLAGCEHYLNGNETAARRAWRQAEALAGRYAMQHEAAVAREALEDPASVGVRLRGA